jgi:hypothetical protein
VTETLENEPVEPTEIIEPEPSVEFVIESKENQGKQISIIFFPRLNWFSFSYLNWVIIGYVLCLFIVLLYLLYALPSLSCLFMFLSHGSWLTN